MPKSFIRRPSFGAFLVLIICAAGPAFAAATEQVKRIIIEESRETLVPSSLALAVAQVESGLRPDRQGADGARGVFQLHPDVADDLGIDRRQLWDARRNVRAGLRVLDNLLDRTEGRWDEALRAFTSLRPNRAGANTERYVSDVLGWERRFAERLALQDAVDGRRRDVLMGHDDWRGTTETDPIDTVGRDSLPGGQDEPEAPQVAALPPYMTPDAIDPSEDDDTDVPVEVRIYRGGRGTEVEITVIEEDVVHEDEHDARYDDAPSWRHMPPPPPMVRHRPAPPRLWKRPRPFSRPFGWRAPRMQRGPRWSPERARMLKRQARRQMRQGHRR